MATRPGASDGAINRPKAETAVATRRTAPSSPRIPDAEAAPAVPVADDAEAEATLATTASTATDHSDADESGVGASGLLRRARDLLRARGEPMTAHELAGAIFGVALPATPLDAADMAVGGLLAGPWIAMLERLLRPSPLFVGEGAGAVAHWGLAAWATARQPLSELEFVVVDVETTGLAPGRHRITEVAAVVVAGGLVNDDPKAMFRSLVNPQRRIPQFITKFTGISERMVARAPVAATVLPKLHAFIGGRPIVGHNVGFDLGFLAYEAEHAGLSALFPLDGVDTIALARRFVPGLRRASLDRVATTLHIPVHTRHRALADAQLTANVFALLLAMARAAGCETLADLRGATERGAPTRTIGVGDAAGRGVARGDTPQPRPTGALYLNPAWRQDFPTTPGVYLMKDAEGEVIYVGKAKRLRDRLASYYNQPLGYTRKMDGLLQNVRSIETRQLGSELEALIVESSLIKQLQPRYNVQLRNHEMYPFIKVDVASAYPRFYSTREVSADGARYFGPFRSKGITLATIELIYKVFPLRNCLRSLPPNGPASDPCLRYHLKRCNAPCRGELAEDERRAYREAVEQACAFLGGERADLIDRLKREMYGASARQDYERAARLRDALRDADQVLLGQRLVTGAVEANNLLIAYPSAEPDQVELFLIRHGRLAQQARVAQDAAALAEAVRALAAHAATLDTPPPCVGREEVDQINIIARWIHHHSDDDARAFFRLPDALRDANTCAQFAEQVARTVTATLTELARDAEIEADGDGQGDDEEWP